MAGPTLGIIPARGGSKGIPGKNLRVLAGRPLLAYTVAVSLACPDLDRVVLSTDAPEIADAGRALGIEVPFMRPSNLARDDTPMVPVLEHAVAWLEEWGWRPEIVVLLQPTAPLRTTHHITAAIALLRETKCDSVASVAELPRHLSPDYVMRIEGGRLVPFLAGGDQLTRRQEARPAVVRDGTVYAVWRDVLMESHSLYGMDCRPLMISAGESVTLDTPQDWEVAELRLAKRLPGTVRQ